MKKLLSLAALLGLLVGCATNNGPMPPTPPTPPTPPPNPPPASLLRDLPVGQFGGQ